MKLTIFIPIYDRHISSKTYIALFNDSLVAILSGWSSMTALQMVQHNCLIHGKKKVPHSLFGIITLKIAENLEN